jgi:hypothetical protein
MIYRISNHPKVIGELNFDHSQKEYIKITIDEKAFESMKKLRGYTSFKRMRPPNQVPEVIISLGFLGKGIEAYSHRLEKLITPCYLIRIGEDKYSELTEGISGKFEPKSKFKLISNFEIILEGEQEEWEIPITED